MRCLLLCVYECSCCHYYNLLSHPSFNPRPAKKIIFCIKENFCCIFKSIFFMSNIYLLFMIKVLFSMLETRTRVFQLFQLFQIEIELYFFRYIDASILEMTTAGTWFLYDWSLNWKFSTEKTLSLLLSGRSIKKGVGTKSLKLPYRLHILDKKRKRKHLLVSSLSDS